MCACISERWTAAARQALWGQSESAILSPNLEHSALLQLWVSPCLNKHMEDADSLAEGTPVLWEDRLASQAADPLSVQGKQQGLHPVFP